MVTVNRKKGLLFFICSKNGNQVKIELLIDLPTKLRLNGRDYTWSKKINEMNGEVIIYNIYERYRYILLSDGNIFV